MARDRSAPRLKRWALTALCALGILLVLLSPTFGRAHPTGQYRPTLPPDALTNGCFPLPDGVRFEFPYQVRTDGDRDGRRRLELQYDLIDADEALAGVTHSFEHAGFRKEPSTDARTVSLTKGSTRVTATAIAMNPLREDQIVRGTLRLDLPVVERQSDDPVCSDVTSTKRFAEGGAR